MEYTFIEQVDISRGRFLLAKFTKLTEDFIKNLYVQSFSDELFGHEPDYNIHNDITYLFVYLISIDAELRTQLANGNKDVWYDKKHYIELYRLDDLRKYYKCIGLDITPLLSLIELNSVEVPGGIDFMYIEGNPEDEQSEKFVVS